MSEVGVHASISNNNLTKIIFNLSSVYQFIKEKDGGIRVSFNLDGIRFGNRIEQTIIITRVHEQLRTINFKFASPKRFSPILIRSGVRNNSASLTI